MRLSVILSEGAYRWHYQCLDVLRARGHQVHPMALRLYLADKIAEVKIK